MTTTLVAFAFTLLALCSPALAEPVAPARPALKLRVTMHDGADRHSFRVVVGHRLPCATASRKLPEQQLDFKVCVTDADHLEIEWYTRRGPSEFRGSSVVPIEPGATTTLGSEREARVEVTIQ